MSIFAPTPEIIAYLKTHLSHLPSTSSTTNNAPTPPPSIDIVIYSPSQHSHLIPSFVEVHVDCILIDHTIATFTTPLDEAKRERIEEYWTDRAKHVESGQRIIFMAFAPPSTSSASADEATTRQPSLLYGGKELAGYVVLYKPMTESGPFRGSVEKLLVGPRYRKRGIARLLMEMLEDVARREGIWLLTLDTVSDSPAEMIYPKWGYTKLGTIPNFGVSPKDHSLIGGVFFWKDLRDPNEQTSQPQSVGTQEKDLVEPATNGTAV